MTCIHPLIPGDIVLHLRSLHLSSMSAEDEPPPSALKILIEVIGRCWTRVNRIEEGPIQYLGGEGQGFKNSPLTQSSSAFLSGYFFPLFSCESPFVNNRSGLVCWTIALAQLASDCPCFCESKRLNCIWMQFNSLEIWVFSPLLFLRGGWFFFFIKWELRAFPGEMTWCSFQAGSMYQGNN